ncbi:unnamed protein product [Meganyctiphanes norvegica]|uniref:Cuticle protein n=1 Tax=Meganyctiphanes norvegica TaxID=48144 RepID=A0AAV2RPI7_MEGNR
MFGKVSLLFTILAAVAFADDPYSNQVYASGPIPYQFSYGIQDAYSGAGYGHNEQGDGKQVLGSYTVDLPDGRTQTVEYSADHNVGYVAKVSYSGKAQYAKGGPAVTFFKGKGGGGGAGGYGH